MEATNIGGAVSLERQTGTSFGALSSCTPKGCLQLACPSLLRAHVRVSVHDSVGKMTASRRMSKRLTFDRWAEKTESPFSPFNIAGCVHSLVHLVSAVCLPGIVTLLRFD